MIACSPSAPEPPSRMRAVSNGSPPTSPKEGFITKLLEASTLADFRQKLTDLFYEQLILPFFGLAAPESLAAAKNKIAAAVEKTLSSHFYQGVRDVHILIHLLQDRYLLANTLKLIQLEVADENPVHPTQLTSLMDALYSGLKTEFERHHDSAAYCSSHD